VKPKSHRHRFGQRYGREDIVRQEKVQLSTLRAGAFYCSQVGGRTFGDHEELSYTL